MTTRLRLKLTTVGGSVGLIIPKIILNTLELRKGDLVEITIEETK